MNAGTPGDPELTGQVVPFGKYKDRPVAELAADAGYRDWVLSQPWVAERYPVLYQVLIQGAPPSQDSPEHNEMQARFLDDGWCLRLASLLDPGYGFPEAAAAVAGWERDNHTCDGCGGQPCRNLDIRYTVIEPEVNGREFEKQGWDVFFQYRSGGFGQAWRCTCAVVLDEHWAGTAPGAVTQWASLDDLIARKEPRKPYGPPSEPSRPDPESYRQLYPPSPYGYQQDRAEKAYAQAAEAYPEQLSHYRGALARYQAELADYEKSAAGYPDWKHYVLDHRDHAAQFRRGHWGTRIAAELKPDLGDDYPSVLRQVQRYLIQRMPAGYGRTQEVPACEAPFLVARRAQFRSVTLDQVREIFASAGIRLVMESEIEGARSWT
jgi:hypothetical protein